MLGQSLSGSKEGVGEVRGVQGGKAAQDVVMDIFFVSEGIAMAVHKDNNFVVPTGRISDAIHNPVDPGFCLPEVFFKFEQICIHYL